VDAHTQVTRIGNSRLTMKKRKPESLSKFSRRAKPAECITAVDCAIKDGKVVPISLPYPALTEYGKKKEQEMFNRIREWKNWK
jgi:hypothetical protein